MPLYEAIVQTTIRGQVQALCESPKEFKRLVKSFQPIPIFKEVIDYQIVDEPREVEEPTSEGSGE